MLQSIGKRYLSIYTSISFSAVHHLLFFSRPNCRFIFSSDVKFLCFITLFTSFSHCTSGRLCLRLPFGDKVIIRLGRLLFSMRNTCPYHFKVFFSVFQNLFVLPEFFSWFYVLFLVVWTSLQFFSKKSVSVLYFFNLQYSVQTSQT